ncbi:hypothetical protein [Streptomyces sp. NPDC095613]|uniref:hypothetical protein n=1 Tax=Streptomyces sp. NPDC095613 TaxID=3155540 RepID=UPI00331EB03E
MSQNKSFRTAAVAVFTVALLGGASPAFAEYLDSASRGASAWSNGGDYANRGVAVKDTSSDGHSVYVNYDRKNNKGLRMNNNAGSGNTVYSSESVSNPVTALRACTNKQLAPDECGAYDRPGDGH